MNNNENIQITKEQTLHKMLKKHEIVIPIIQRDYAQGRDNDNVLEIRENFIKDIFGRLSENQKLKLSFVYGTEEGSQYIPYDGQQRLTLVYLLSLYLSEYAGERITIKINNDTENILSKFYYKTRDFSSDFCAYLTLNKDGFFRNNILSEIPYDKEHSLALKNAIINDNKFFSAWLSDPTVSSMVNVLQTIHILFNKQFDDDIDIETRKKIALDFNRKIVDGYVFFDWCSLGKASDSIYVKMNGRGKMLSAFDNFKNTLYGILNDLREAENDKIKELSTQKGTEKEIELITSNLSKLKDFELKMDSKWTDLFWEYRTSFSDTTKDNINIAPAMMNFLYFAFEYKFCVKTKKFFFGKGETVRWLDENKIVSFLSIFKEAFKSKKDNVPPVLNIDDYIWVNNLLEVLYNRLYKKDDILLINEYTNRKFFTEKELFISLCVQNANYDYRAHATAAVYYEYLIGCSSFTQTGSLDKCNDTYKNDWAQFVFNIMETVGFFNSHYNDLINDKHFYIAVSEFISRAIEIDKNGNLSNIMMSYKQEDLDKLKENYTLHADYQLQEEYEKWKLVNSSEDWKQAISKAESIPYFNGQIYFMLEASYASGVPKLSIFKKLIKTVTSLIDSEDSSKFADDNSFRRLLLCFGDYRIDSRQGFSNTWSLCESNVHDGTAKYYLWRSFFDTIYSKKTEYITKALLALCNNDNDMKAAIKNSKPHSSIENWQDVIITYPEILQYINPFGIVDTYDVPFIITAWNCKKQIRPEIHLKNYGINIMLYGLYRKLGFKDDGEISACLYKKWKLPSGQIIEQIEENFFKLFEGTKKIGEGSFTDIQKIAQKA